MEVFGSERLEAWIRRRCVSFWSEVDQGVVAAMDLDVVTCGGRGGGIAAS